MAADSPTATSPRRWSTRPWWPAAKRTLTIAISVTVLALVVNKARTVDWSEVGSALLAYPITTLALAAAFALASHAVYGTYDLIGRRLTGHTVPRLRVFGIALVSYAFNLNLGSLVGAIGARYRLYGRVGLVAEQITQVMVLSMLTNWLGYLIVGGLVFALSPMPLPPGWAIGSGGLRLIGVGLLAVAGAYLALCALAKRRTWQLRNHAVNLPSLRVAALQVLLSTTNWLLIAGVVFTLLHRHIDYPTVLSVLLIAAVAGLITHVPAGLGVLEAVFLALLAHRIPQGELLAALLAYRAIYYLAPFAVALGLFFVVDAEDRSSKSAHASTARAAVSSDACIAPTHRGVQ